MPFYILNIRYYIINSSFYIVSTQYYSLNTKYTKSFFFEKSAFEPGLLFLRERGLFFELVIFPQFLPNPYTRMCVSTIGSFSLFRKKNENAW